MTVLPFSEYKISYGVQSIYDKLEESVLEDKYTAAGKAIDRDDAHARVLAAVKQEVKQGLIDPAEVDSIFQILWGREE